MFPCAKKMTIKLLQLNIWKGTYLKEIVDYVRKETFDILTFQEVTSGSASSDKTSDIFELLKEELPMKGIQSVNFKFAEDDLSFFSVAIFYAPSLTLQRSEEIPLAPISYLSLKNPDWEKASRTALSGTFIKEDREFNVITTHGAWSPEPIDTEEKIRQANVLINYLKTVKNPFVLTGDFNLRANSTVMGMYQQLAINLSEKFNIQNTLNARVHYAKKLFPPGIAVDHILVTPGVTVDSFQVIEDVDLSDHLGLAAKLRVSFPL